MVRVRNFFRIIVIPFFYIVECKWNSTSLELEISNLKPTVFLFHQVTFIAITELFLV